jgi:hypothetical protein
MHTQSRSSVLHFLKYISSNFAPGMERGGRARPQFGDESSACAGDEASILPT